VVGALGSFGEWQLLRRIAVGGMGEIFEAVRSGAGAPAQRYALKVLLPQHAKDPELIRMLLDEAQLQATLIHPNLVQVREAGEVDGLPFIALEYIDGPALSELIEAGRGQDVGFPLSLALYVAQQLLRALVHVHQACGPEGEPLAIVHRDVTPHNVLISARGEVKLGDFGIALSRLREARTRTGVVKGKLRYLAPEQASHSTVDARCDLYLVGLILFELIAGEPYLGGESELELLQLAAEPPVRRLAERAEVDAPVDRLVTRALQRFPEERFQTAQGFLDEVEACIHDQEAVGSPTQLVALIDELGWVAAEPGLGPARPLILPTTAAAAASIEGTRRVAAPAGRRRAAWPALLLVATLAVAATLWLQRLASDPAPVDAASPTLAAVEADPGHDASSGSAPTANEAPDATTGSPRSIVELDAAPAPPARPELRRPRPARPEPPRREEGRDASRVVLGPDSATPDVQGGNAAAAIKTGQRRLASLRERLQAQGILLQDLSPAQRQALQQIDTQLAQGQGDRALASLDEVERELMGLRVDAAFVRGKLRRVKLLMDQPGQRAESRDRLEQLSSRALQAFMDGGFVEANRLLNSIVLLLPAPARDIPQEP